MSHAASASLRNEEQIVALIPALRAFAHRFVGSNNDVDDLVQEAVSRALGHLDHFRPGTSMKSWLFAIIRNTYCTGYRRQVRESCGRLDDAASYDLPMSATQDWAMRAIDVDTALAQLSAGERKALLLVAAGASYEDAALSCHCKIGTIKSRVSRARLHLAELLGESDLCHAISMS